MKRLVNKLVEDNENRPDEYYTPQNLAWKLLMDDLDEELTGVLQANSPDFQWEEDPSSFLFEILITIFMEMIFDMAIIMNSSENEFNNCDKEFKPDMKKFNIDDFLPKLKEKFERVSILINIEKHKRTNSDEFLKEIIDDRYCRVILRYYHEDKKLFRKYNVPDDLHYHMILNGNYKKKNKLDDIYAIIILNDFVYQISFLPIKQLGSEKCGFGA
jgi:hypothetical protein